MNTQHTSEKAMAPHSSTLAWKIPWMEEPGGLQSMGSDTTERLHFHFSLSCIGEGNGNPLQCSCLENPRDSRAWWATIYGVTQSWTWLERLSSSSSSIQTGSWSHLRGPAARAGTERIEQDQEIGREAEEWWGIGTGCLDQTLTSPAGGRTSHPAQRVMCQGKAMNPPADSGSLASKDKSSSFDSENRNWTVVHLGGRHWTIRELWLSSSWESQMETVRAGLSKFSFIGIKCQRQ